MKGRPWTEAEVTLLIDLINEGCTFVAAGVQLGRGTVAVRKKWISLGTERVGSTEVHAVVVPEERLADRDRRRAAPQRTLIGAWVGDPPVGYSALDRRGAPQAKVSLHQLPEGAAPPLVPGDSLDGFEEEADHGAA
jgi:hypothetical protein